MLLTRDEILARKDLPTEDVDAFGGKVRLRVMPGRQRDAFENRVTASGDRVPDNVRAHLVSLCAVDESGKPLFTADHIAALGELSSVELDKLFDAAMRLNGLREVDIKKLEKNSATGPSDASGSNSATVTGELSMSCNKSSTPPTSPS